MHLSGLDHPHRPLHASATGPAPHSWKPGHLALASPHLQAAGLLRAWMVGANHLQCLSPTPGVPGDVTGVGTACRDRRAEPQSGRNSKKKGEGERKKKRLASKFSHFYSPSQLLQCTPSHVAPAGTPCWCCLFLTRAGQRSNVTFSLTLPPSLTHIHFLLLLDSLGILFLQENI